LVDILPIYFLKTFLGAVGSFDTLFLTTHNVFASKLQILVLIRGEDLDGLAGK
jgi:hypothetical protein